MVFRPPPRSRTPAWQYGCSPLNKDPRSKSVVAWRDHSFWGAWKAAWPEAGEGKAIYSGGDRGPRGWKAAEL